MHYIAWDWFDASRGKGQIRREIELNDETLLPFAVNNTFRNYRVRDSLQNEVRNDGSLFCHQFWLQC